MKAINSPVRVAVEAANGGNRAQRSSGALKKIARKRQRAAERQFLAREVLVAWPISEYPEITEPTGHSSRRREQLLHGACVAVQQMLAKAQAAAEKRLAMGDTPGRIDFYVHRKGGELGKHPALLSCA